MEEFNCQLEPIMLGFGHGYICIGEELFLNVKKMKADLIENKGYIVPNIHMVDHDLDSNKNIVWLEHNEYVIRIYGKEMERKKLEDTRENKIVERLKDIIIENLSVLQNESVNK